QRVQPVAQFLAAFPANVLFPIARSEEHTSELQSLTNLVCRLLLEKKKKNTNINRTLTQKTKERKQVKRDSEIKQDNRTGGPNIFVYTRVHRITDECLSDERAAAGQ